MLACSKSNIDVGRNQAHIRRTPIEEKNIKAMTPILAGKVISKFDGDIESKEKEFKEMLEETERFKSEMLTRKYDPNNIICINTKLNYEQLFSISSTYDLDFVEIADFIESNIHIDIAKLWFEKETTLLVAYETEDNYFDVNEDALIPKTAIYNMSKKPIKTPKIKITDESVEEYFRIKSY